MLHCFRCCENGFLSSHQIFIDPILQERGSIGLWKCRNGSREKKYSDCDVDFRGTSCSKSIIHIEIDIEIQA
jgi:hypothetical protein